MDDGRASVQCPRCGAPSRRPCETVRPGASLVGYHRERGYRHDELLDLGYIKYTLVNESTQHPLFLWRRRTQRPIIRDGYRQSD
ncbi:MULTISPECIES: zinc finger domain-containing protein [Mycobacteriaceae]|uniref:zinc finger domain-containing protein n=1 Tax=Mycobacteriaceae TaxID=1762 RepID=UPI003B8A5D9A